VDAVDADAGADAGADADAGATGAFGPLTRDPQQPHNENDSISGVLSWTGFRSGLSLFAGPNTGLVSGLITFL